MKIRILKPALQVFFVLILLLAELAVFIPEKVQAAPVVEGNEVSISLDEAYISAAPATLTASGWVEVTFWTRNYEGPVDVVYGFNGIDNVKAVTPEVWESYDHTLTRQVDAVLTGQFKPEKIVSTKTDAVRPTLADTDLSLNSKYAEVTYEAIGKTQTMKLAYDSYDNGTYYYKYNGKTSETYHETYTDWNEKTVSSVALNYAGATKWDVTTHKSVAKNEVQKTRVWIDIPFTGTDKVEGKYNIGIKPSPLSLEQAKSQGKLWLLDPWYNSSWAYRKSMVINHSDDGAQTNYRMKLMLGESAGSAGADMNMAGHALSSFNDVRFTAADGTTLCSYYIKSISGATPNQTATVWIKVPTIDAHPANTTIYIYYGNAGAPAASSMVNTFPEELAIKFEGADADVGDYVCETGQTATTVGTAQLDTAQYKENIASLLLDGDSDYCTFADSAAYAAGTGAFTAECWVRLNSLIGAGSYFMVMGARRNAPTVDGWVIYLDGDEKAILYCDVTKIQGTTAFAVNAWHHIAIVGNGGAAGSRTIKLYIDGTQEGSTYTNNYNFTDQKWLIGVDTGLATFFLNGWEDSVDFIKGTQRWTANFTPVGKTNFPTWNSFGAEEVPCVLTGTATAAIESDIVAGGKTIILTLTGDTWVAAGATFDAQRANIIAGLTSAGAEAHGWNAEVKAKIPVTDVVRTNGTVVTITLSSETGYYITANETITVTVPATALVGGVAATAAPTFTITKVAPTVTTGVCSGSGTTWAVLNGTVTGSGSSPITQRGFDYGLTTAYGSSSLDSGTWGATAYSKGLTGLSPSTVYHYRAKAFNGVWAYGADAFFATKGSPAITTYLNTGDDSCMFIYGTTVGAQTFTTSATTEYSVTSIRLLLNKTLVPGTVTVSLRRTAGGVPTGVDLTSGTIDGATIATSYTWYDVTMAAETTLELNTMYAVVVKAPSGDISNYICWRYSSIGGLANGNGVTSTDSGITWSTSPQRMCGLGASLSSAPYDDDAWVDPTNVYSDNSAYASVTAATFDNLDYTEVLKCTTFGLSVPAAATITGIKVEVKRHCGAGSAKDGVIQLTKDGTNRVGASLATATAWPAADAIASYGDAATMWGTTWTPAEVNAATFGVHVAAQATADDTDVYVDFVRITVYYSYDYMFELWGNQALEIQDVKVFQTYRETGDWLVTVRYIDIYKPYFDTYDVKQYFTLKLVDATGTPKASTAVPAWGNRVGSIYLSAASVTSLTWGGDYRVRIYGTFTGNPYTEYALVAADWVGDDLNKLDSWVFTSADVIGTYYSTTLTTYVAERGEVLNAGGSGIFNTCIGGLSQVRPAIFQIYSNPSTYTPATIGQTYRQALKGWETNIGPDGTVMLTNLGKIIGVGGDIISVIAFLGMVVLLMALGFPAGTTPAACALSIPLLGAAIWFGMDLLYIGILALVAAFLFVKNFWIDKGT